MNKKAMLAFSLFVTISLLACSSETTSKSQLEPLVKASPKNIILFIGDGMGPSYMKAYRMFKDDPHTTKVELTRFDPLFVGLLSTDPSVLDDVTDSAASATAMATGYKVANGVLSVDKSNKALVTVLERAKQLGLSTGLVATSTISHATPAAFASHINNRRLQAKIADQYIDNRYQNMPYIDVILGGGRVYFERDDRNISQQFQQLGYQLVNTKQELLDNQQPKVLGLFTDHVFKKMIDRDPQTPSLADMTSAAIKQLSKNKKGFFLMVEASQIDFAGHIQDISGVMSEMQDLDDALQVAMQFVDNSALGDSQILLTADHSTGGLSVGTEVNGKKILRLEPKMLLRYRTYARMGIAQSIGKPRSSW
ncbi:MAG: alkaline phosphatase [Enterobacterales bacterium]|nr:alkaline phosphatase [Enterobacterales bacterium]